MRTRRLGFIVGAMALWLATATSAAQLTVGTGSTVDLGTGSLDLGCAHLTVSGTLAAGTGMVDQVQDVSILFGGTLNGESATLNVTGDWSGGGSFDAGSGSVNFVDGCGRSSAVISGDSTFFALGMTTSTGKLVAFEAGSIQIVTQSLALSGTAGDRLTIRSTVNGSEASIALHGSHTTNFVDVQDNHATVNPISLGPGSVMGPNTSGWSQLSVPGLSAAAMALLMLAILWAGRWGLRAGMGLTPTR